MINISAYIEGNIIYLRKKYFILTGYNELPRIFVINNKKIVFVCSYDDCNENEWLEIDGHNLQEKFSLLGLPDNYGWMEMDIIQYLHLLKEFTCIHPKDFGVVKNLNGIYEFIIINDGKIIKSAQYKLV